MQCPSCKEQIDDDSRYCDQCGSQIMVCKECGRPGKGKRCIFDGKEMVVAGNSNTSSSSDSDTVKFSSNGIVFEAKDGDIIGRKAGPFASMFAGQQTVSGTHCKVSKISGSWHIQDLGSTNGTFAQENRLEPNAPHPLSNNAAIKIGTIEFIVTWRNNL
jgi:hypothetical protein